MRPICFLPAVVGLKVYACCRFAWTGKSLYLGDEIDVDATGNEDGPHA